MTKQHEFLIHNEEHMQEILRLESLHWEIIVEGLNLNVYDRVNHLPELIKEVKQLVENNYYYDADIDPLGNVKKSWDNLIQWEKSFSPKMITFTIQNEVENRRKRKRPYTLMWEKLEDLGLDKRTKKKSLNNKVKET